MPAEMKQTQRDSKVGDIFKIPIDADRFVFGQIIDQYKSTLLVIVFGEVFDQNLSESVPVKTLSPALLASTFDALLYNGTWIIVCNDAA